MALDLDGGARAPLDFEVEEVLQVQPELRVGFEVARQAQSRVGGNAAAFVDNFGDASRRHRIMPLSHYPLSTISKAKTSGK